MPALSWSSSKRFLDHHLWYHQIFLLKDTYCKNLHFIVTVSPPKSYFFHHLMYNLVFPLLSSCPFFPLLNNCNHVLLCDLSISFFSICMFPKSSFFIYPSENFDFSLSLQISSSSSSTVISQMPVHIVLLYCNSWVCA